MKVKCVDAYLMTGPKPLTKDMIYEVQEENDEEFLVENCWYMKYRFQEIDQNEIDTMRSIPIAKQVAVDLDPEETKMRKLLRPKLADNECICGGIKGKCPYHP